MGEQLSSALSSELWSTRGPARFQADGDFARPAGLQNANQLIESAAAHAVVSTEEVVDAMAAAAEKSDLQP
ncbi:hypothetical protein [Mycolicibacterium hodleri]|uniref:Uncharacterized protein n=1 Tax=Mycolicibacterium hodleri TaxID=49897 RepID=A0A502EJJ1_9MYCO|nr:hypothetical protein [Mycolicibacterium hodleri]TPG36666.1 hypothetical protein EAH80_01585 [Mycolicibacterium hodleri]